MFPAILKKKMVRFLTAAGLMTLALAWAGYNALGLWPDPLAGNRPGYAPSLRIEDREGRLLRELLSGRETRSRWAALDEMGPYVVSAALAAEDKRFFQHPGVDPLAVIRAAGQNLAARRVVSGASTITLQVARLLDPGPRTLKRKIREAFVALRMEKFHSKNRILEEYLNRAPFGNLAYGLPAAARLYFDKTPENLSPSEAAFLMALPQAPGLLNPYKNPDAALARRDRILSRMAELGFITLSQANRGKRESIDLRRLRSHFHAPHFVMFLGKNQPPGTPLVRTTLDLEIQTEVERMTAQAVGQLKKDNLLSQAAVLVMDLPSREILAWVGSADFFDPREGQNDGVLAKRQPGSALKPFTYATAFDRGFTPADKIDDEPVEYGLGRGVYTPSNYSGRYHGRVSLRTALASSLNVPAVKLLEKLGLEPVHRRMKAAGLVSLDKESDYYGLGLTLGDGEVSLLELAEAYAVLADGGLYRPAVWNFGAAQVEGRPVFSPQAAWLVTDILSDDAARATGFGRYSALSLPFPAAAKTGTSKNFRDNWCAGYTSTFLVAVWAGNFDARPMGRVSGITGAGPLWRQVMRYMAEKRPPGPFPKPDGIVEMAVCADTGLRATPLCPNQVLEKFSKTALPGGYCLRHRLSEDGEQVAENRGLPNRLAILTPRTGERYLFDPGIEPGFQNLGLKAHVPPGFDSIVWVVNGKVVKRLVGDPGESPEVFWPLAPGLVEIKLIGKAGDRIAASDQVVINVN